MGRGVQDSSSVMVFGPKDGQNLVLGDIGRSHTYTGQPNNDSTLVREITFRRSKTTADVVRFYIL